MKIENKGITLVALIITIIVLLILATVSISLVINNGILDKAQHGVDKYSEEEELEQIKLAVASAMLKGNGFLTTNNLNSELQVMFGEEAEAKTIDEYWRFNGYKIEQDGKVERTLPKEYQEVEYIESTGTQYIDTMFVVKDYNKVKIEYVSTLKGYVIALLEREFYYGLRPGAQGLNNRGIRWHAVSGVYDMEFTPEEGNYYKFIQDGGDLYIDNSLNSEYISRFNVNVIEGTIPLYIFARNNNGVADAHSNTKLKKLIINYSNVKIRSFIPCYSTTTVTNADGVQVPENTKGLYDLVEGKFYTNKGTGSFGYGMDDGTYVAPQ